jgi:hypothetical protein
MKGTNLYNLVKGGQVYRALSISKTSMESSLRINFIATLEACE